MKDIHEQMIENIAKAGLLSPEEKKIFIDIHREDMDRVETEYNYIKNLNRINIIRILVFSLAVISYYFLQQQNLHGFSRYFIAIYLFSLHGAMFPSGFRKWTLKIELPKKGEILSNGIDTALMLLYFAWIIPNDIFFYINLIALPLFIFAHHPQKI